MGFILNNSKFFQDCVLNEGGTDKSSSFNAHCYYLRLCRS